MNENFHSLLLPRDLTLETITNTLMIAIAKDLQKNDDFFLEIQTELSKSLHEKAELTVDSLRKNLAKVDFLLSQVHRVLQEITEKSPSTQRESPTET